MVLPKNSLGSVAALTSLVLAQHASAFVVSSSISNYSFVDETDINLDIDGDGTDDFLLSINDSSPWAELYGISSSNEVVVTSGDPSRIEPLSSGSVVNAGSTFNQGFALDDFFSAGTNYVGITFQRSSATHYGWIEINYSGGQPSDGMIVSAAWENVADTAILTGASAVPEPGTTALWGGLGTALGLLAWRRRKRS